MIVDELKVVFSRNSCNVIVCIKARDVKENIKKNIKYTQFIYRESMKSEKRYIEDKIEVTHDLNCISESSKESSVVPHLNFKEEHVIYADFFRKMINKLDLELIKISCDITSVDHIIFYGIENVNNFYKDRKG